MKRFLFAAFVVGAIGLTVGCFLDPLDTGNNSSPEVVLQGFLTPDAPVEIVLRSTVAPDAYYAFMDLDEFAIEEAIVEVVVDGKAFDLTAGKQPGAYSNPALLAEAGLTYGVAVTFPSDHEWAGHELTATTTVPEQVRHTDVTYHKSQPPPLLGVVTEIKSFVFPKTLANPDSFPITGDEYTPFNISWQDADGAAGYTLGVLAQDTSGILLMRKREYKNWVDGDFNNPADRQFMAKSGMLIMPDSTNADIYWLLFHYEGPTHVVLIAADEGYWQYFRTYLGGPGGNSGNDADTGVSLNVKGGIGVFGSYTADTIATHIANEWQPNMYRDDFLSDSQRVKVERYEALNLVPARLGSSGN